MTKEDTFANLSELRYKYICLEVANMNFASQLQAFADQLVILGEMSDMISSLKMDLEKLNGEERDRLLNFEEFLQEKNVNLAMVRRALTDYYDRTNPSSK